MKCRKCGRGIPEGASLFRVNEKGVKGIWECERCVDWSTVDPEVALIDHIISGEKEQ